MGDINGYINWTIVFALLMLFTWLDQPRQPWRSKLFPLLVTYVIGSMMLAILG